MNQAKRTLFMICIAVLTLGMIFLVLIPLVDWLLDTDIPSTVVTLVIVVVTIPAAIGAYVIKREGKKDLFKK